MCPKLVIPPENLRILSRSHYLDPQMVLKYHWWSWNWGYLSENPVIPAWLIIALPNKPWDWISIAYLPCSNILRKRLHGKIYELTFIDFIPNRRYREQYKIRIANEIYNRMILTKRKQRWFEITNKILNKNTSFGIHDCRINRIVSSFLCV